MWCGEFLIAVLVFIIFISVLSFAGGLLFVNSVVFYGLYALGLMLGLSLGVGLIVSSWYGMVLLLVYLGGLMVMFGYFLAICPNQSGQSGSWGWGLGVGGVGVLFVDWVGLEVGGLMMGLDELLKGYNLGLLSMLAFLLLLALVVVVKMVALKQGPLRPFVVRR